METKYYLFMCLRRAHFQGDLFLCLRFFFNVNIKPISLSFSQRVTYNFICVFWTERNFRSAVCHLGGCFHDLLKREKQKSGGKT